MAQHASNHLPFNYFLLVSFTIYSYSPTEYWLTGRVRVRISLHVLAQLLTVSSLLEDQHNKELADIK